MAVDSRLDLIRSEELFRRKRASMERIGEEKLSKQKENEPSCIGRSRDQIRFGHFNMAPTHWKLQHFSFDLTCLFKLLPPLPPLQDSGIVRVCVRASKVGTSS